MWQKDSATQLVLLPLKMLFHFTYSLFYRTVFISLKPEITTAFDLTASLYIYTPQSSVAGQFCPFNICTAVDKRAEALMVWTVTVIFNKIFRIFYQKYQQLMIQIMSIWDYHLA